MRTRRPVWGVLALSLLLPACGSSGADSADEADPVEDSVPVSDRTGGRDETTTTSSGSAASSSVSPPSAPPSTPQVAAPVDGFDPCAGWPGLADYAIGTGLLDPSGLADASVPVRWDDGGFWVFEPRGADGAATLVAGLTGAETVCDGPVSSEAAVAIDAYLAAGGGVEHRDVLLAAADPVRPAGFRAAPTTSDGPVLPRQRARDALEMAANAARNGDDDGARQLIDLAMSIYRSEAERRIEAGTDAQDLLGVEASAQLMGDDDLADTARDALYELIKQQVADAAADFDPCAVAGTSRNSALVEALARAELVGVPDVAEAEATPERRAYDHNAYKQMIQEWSDRNEAVANGEEDDVCPGFLFRVEAPWSAGLSSGTLDVWLVSCDLQTWTGTLTSSGEMVLPDGSMAFERAYELRFEFGPNGFWDGEVAEAELDGRIQWRLEGSGFAGDWSTQAATGNARFRRVDPYGEFHAEFDDVNLEGKITAEGHTVPVAFPTEFPPVLQLSTLEPGGDMCKDDA